MAAERPACPSGAADGRKWSADFDVGSHVSAGEIPPYGPGSAGGLIPSLAPAIISLCELMTCEDLFFVFCQGGVSLRLDGFCEPDDGKSPNASRFRNCGHVPHDKGPLQAAGGEVDQRAFLPQVAAASDR